MLNEKHHNRITSHWWRSKYLRLEMRSTLYCHTNRLCSSLCMCVCASQPASQHAGSIGVCLCVCMYFDGRYVLSSLPTAVHRTHAVRCKSNNDEWQKRWLDSTHTRAWLPFFIIHRIRRETSEYQSSAMAMVIPIWAHWHCIWFLNTNFIRKTPFLHVMLMYTGTQCDARNVRKYFQFSLRNGPSSRQIRE